MIHSRLSRVGLGFMLKTQAFFDNSPPGFLGELRNSAFIVGDGILETSETNEIRALCSLFPPRQRDLARPLAGRGNVVQAFCPAD